VTCPRCGSGAVKDVRRVHALELPALWALGLAAGVGIGIERWGLFWVLVSLTPVTYGVALLLWPRRWRCRNCRQEWRDDGQNVS